MREIITNSLLNSLKMNLVFLIFLAGFRCIDSYSIIQSPDATPTFKIFWNVPTHQCNSKGIPFTHIYEDFGIIQNARGEFSGDKVSILYHPGKFPNHAPPEYGKIPQRGNLKEHLEAFERDLQAHITEEAFDGVGIIDMERWRPVFHQNYGYGIYVKNTSYLFEKETHEGWKESWLQAEAKLNFERSARQYMEQTLDKAKEMRPLAQWGYYGFPYCFNMQGKNKQEACSAQTKRQNDEAYWLWAGSTALYPSVYSESDLSSSQLASLIKGRVAEAKRVASKDTPIFPYFQLHYVYNGQPIDRFMTKKDLETALDALHKSNASGVIIWGAYNGVNTIEKCKEFLKYVNEVVGPAVVKYTNPKVKATETRSTSKVDTNNTIKAAQVSTLVDLILGNIANTTNVLNSNVYSQEDITIVLIRKSYHTPSALASATSITKYNCSDPTPMNINFNEIHIHNSNSIDVLNSNKALAIVSSNGNVNSTDNNIIDSNKEGFNVVPEEAVPVVNSTDMITKSELVLINDKLNSNETNTLNSLDTHIMRDYAERNYTQEIYTDINNAEESFTEINDTGLNNTEKYDKEENNTEESYTEVNNTEDNTGANGTDVIYTGRSYTVEGDTEENNTEGNYTEESNTEGNTEENYTKINYTGRSYTVESDTEENYTEGNTEENHTKINNTGRSYTVEGDTEENNTEDNYTKESNTEGNTEENLLEYGKGLNNKEKGQNK